MKNIFSYFSIDLIQKNIINSSKRFPLAVIIIIIISICSFYLVNVHIDPSLERKLVSGILALILAFFFSISIDLNSESRGYNSTKKYLYQGIPIGFGILFFYHFHLDVKSVENIVFFCLSLSGIIGFLFFAPYLKSIVSQKYNQGAYYSYFYKIATLIHISYILGGMLFVGGAIAIVAIEALFGIHMYDEVYGNWAIISLSIFTPFFGLSNIPKKSDFKNSKLSLNVFFSFLVKYVAIPFVVTYFLILYAYFIKVLLNFGDWPKGEISWMVISFSILGYMTYIFSYVFEQKNIYITAFRKYFPYVVIPQVIMLFYSIYLRIAQYDITVNRYFVIIFGLWLVMISLYLIFSKQKFLAYIPAILTFFIVIISIGPWSVYSLPESRQFSRLKENLIQANILQENIIHPLNVYSDIDPQLSRDIYSGIQYLCEFDNCQNIKQLFSQEDISGEKWELVSTIAERIKVKPHYKVHVDNSYKNIYLDYQESHFPINVESYSEIVQLNNSQDQDNIKYARIDFSSQQLIIKENGNDIEVIDISEVLATLSQINTSTQLASQMNFNLEDGKYKILLESIYLPSSEHNGAKRSYGASGYVLIR